MILHKPYSDAQQSGGALHESKRFFGYDAPQVMQAFPQLPSEFATKSLKCPQVMRCFLALLHEGGESQKAVPVHQDLHK